MTVTHSRIDGSDSRPATSASSTDGPPHPAAYAGAAHSRSARVALRSRLCAVAVGMLLVAVAVIALCLGDYPLSVGEVLRALTGRAGFDSTVVLQWRLPRIVAAIVFGACLGISGALFQTLTRNPLGSPDIIGFSTGAYTGVLAVRLVLPGSTLAASTLGTSVLASTTAGALLGGFTTAIVVYLLAYRRGVQGFRLVIVGIGVTAALSGVNSWLILRARDEVAMGAAIWGTGTLSLTTWGDVVPAVVAVALTTPLIAAARRPLRQLELGDDAAAAHGLRVERTRLAILSLGVLLAALVTAAAGPIAFVALAAPQIAKRLAGLPGIPLLHSALLGSLLLLGADVIAQHVGGNPLPAGMITVIFGGMYLFVLLIMESRA